MKSPLLFIFLFLHVMAISQITFEEINSPKDFNISNVRKSPKGEYFVQAGNDRNSIYSSTDGQVWTKSGLPVTQRLDEIQFFSDGTPLLKPESDEHLIRRNNIWYTMDLPSGFGKVETSYIKDDTLFVYENNRFAYSLDKGSTFTTLFNFVNPIIDHQTHLFKFDHYLILHHTAGASDSLSVFSMTGQRVLYKELDISSALFIHKACGELLIVDDDIYYLLKEDGLIFQSGATSSIIPSYNRHDPIWSQNGQLFRRLGNTIYKTTGCNFSWEPVVTDDRIEASDKFWIDEKESIFLYDNLNYSFLEWDSTTHIWDNLIPDIVYPYVNSVDESVTKNQFLLTSNAFFGKSASDLNWIRNDSLGLINDQAQYAPGGDLYINKRDKILYSKDNGQTFTTIDVPETVFQIKDYTLYVLDDDILFITNDLLGESFYSLNNGHNWTSVSVFIQQSDPIVKLAGHYIYIFESNFYFNMSRIDMITNQVESEELTDLSSALYYIATMQDDGVIYFLVYEFLIPNSPQGFYRYTFGSGLEYLGLHDELSAVFELISSDNELYGFTPTEYYTIDENNVESFPIIGLPETNNIRYILSTNEYLYAVVDDHTMYRSTQPLSFPRTLTGYIYHDDAGTCLADTSDPTLVYWQVSIENDETHRIVSTDRNGKYKVSLREGDYLMKVSPLNENWDLCQDMYSLHLGENDTEKHQDFKAIGLNACAFLSIDFSTPFLRRCFENYYSVSITNTGPEPSEGTLLTLKLDPFFELISATYPYIILSDSLIQFDLGSLAVNDIINIRINFKISCNAELGMEHCLTGILTDANECNYDRSTYKECQKNIGAIDPNDKRTFNANGTETQRVDKGEYIYYHIRFQNTGTDTAFNIRILDPLSPMLDLSTLEMLSVSHPYTYSITDGPDLEIVFSNIALPDSTIDEVGSNGYVKFRIKPLTTFDYGTIIPNQAGIIFDFNAPVLTNNTEMLIQHPVRVNDIKETITFDLYPNPSNKIIMLNITEEDRAHIDAYEIVDFLGRVLNQSPCQGSLSIPVDYLPPGMYHLVLIEKGIGIGTSSFLRN